MIIRIKESIIIIIISVTTSAYVAWCKHFVFPLIGSGKYYNIRDNNKKIRIKKIII